MRKAVFGIAFILAAVVPVLVAVSLFPAEEHGAQAAAIGATRRTAIVSAIERVAPAVVTINVLEIQRQRMLDPFAHDFWEFFHGGRGGYHQRAVEGVGTGFIIDDQGHIITNFHVLQDAHYISSVTLSDGRQLDVELIGADERTDIAVLKAEGRNLPFVQFADISDLMVGEWAIAIGNPFANMMGDTQPSVSVGVVSATNRRVSQQVGGGERLYQNLIQTDAAINPGNSGGPLVDALGRVVGMNTMIFSNSGGYQGLGFALPADRVRGVAEEIIEHGRRRDPWFGFHGEAVEMLTPQTVQRLGLRVAEGVLVTEILPDAPAYKAGVRPGDVIVSINGEEVAHPVDVDYINWGLFVGDSVKLTINRNGREEELRFLIKEVAQ